jgi:hypothetical protein
MLFNRLLPPFFSFLEEEVVPKLFDNVLLSSPSLVVAIAGGISLAPLPDPTPSASMFIDDENN